MVSTEVHKLSRSNQRVAVSRRVRGRVKSWSLSSVNKQTQEPTRRSSRTVTRDSFVHEEECPGWRRCTVLGGGCPNAGCKDGGQRRGRGRKRILMFPCLMVGIPASAGQTRQAGTKETPEGGSRYAQLMEGLASASRCRALTKRLRSHYFGHIYKGVCTARLSTTYTNREQSHSRRSLKSDLIFFHINIELPINYYC